ncbi:MAG: hypothetical protein D6732_24310 [Methanobacteriota archaeon]|nr:MAG: hypothetical protein D6732_24310 [Euryarchaeota archaeon]
MYKPTFEQIKAAIESFTKSGARFEIINGGIVLTNADEVFNIRAPIIRDWFQRYEYEALHALRKINKDAARRRPTFIKVPTSIEEPKATEKVYPKSLTTRHHSSCYTQWLRGEKPTLSEDEDEKKRR